MVKSKLNNSKIVGNELIYLFWNLIKCCLHKNWQLPVSHIMQNMYKHRYGSTLNKSDENRKQYTDVWKKDDLWKSLNNPLTFFFFKVNLLFQGFIIYRASWRMIKVKRVFANNNKRAIQAVNKKLRSAFEHSLSLKE